MYIALAWEPDAGTDPLAAQQLVDQALAAIGFLNAFSPKVPGFVFANTPDGTRSKVDMLQTELRKLPITFAISASLKGWDIWRSTNVPRDRCRTVVDHG